jgi:hypothetical protein
MINYLSKNKSTTLTLDPELEDLQISILRNVLLDEYTRFAGILKRSTDVGKVQAYSRRVNAVALLLHQLQ